MSQMRLKTPLWALASASLLLSACGEREIPVKEVPKSEEVRDFYGLGNGSCWRYRYSINGSTVFARASVQGPNTQSIAGESLFELRFTEAGGGQPQEWYLNAEADGEIRLARTAEGVAASRVIKTYEDKATRPTFLKMDYDMANAAIVRAGDRFENDATPTIDGAAGDVENHVWVVNSVNEPVNTPDGSKESVSLTYRKRIGSETLTANYNLVPGLGFAKIVNAQGVTFQVCDQRVCDSQGNCVGANSCDELTCN